MEFRKARQVACGRRPWGSSWLGPCLQLSSALSALWPLFRGTQFPPSLIRKALVPLILCVELSPSAPTLLVFRRENGGPDQSRSWRAGSSQPTCQHMATFSPVRSLRDLQRMQIQPLRVPGCPACPPSTNCGRKEGGESHGGTDPMILTLLLAAVGWLLHCAFKRSIPWLGIPVAMEMAA